MEKKNFRVDIIIMNVKLIKLRNNFCLYIYTTFYFTFVVQKIDQWSWELVSFHSFRLNWFSMVSSCTWRNGRAFFKMYNWKQWEGLFNFTIQYQWLSYPCLANISASSFPSSPLCPGNHTSTNLVVITYFFQLIYY